MTKAPKLCFDRVLPKDLAARRPVRSLTGGRTRAISPIGKQWPNGSTIRIRFLNGTPQQWAMVEEYAPEWTDHANLTFEFTDDPRAEIRVTFNDWDGAWSYVGTDNLDIPRHAATMNLGWQDKGVILHEFGHMIGLGHEHQNPDGGIRWNEAAVIADLAGPPNHWSEAETRHNVLNKYRADQIHGTTFDPKSIMLYAFPNAWTIGNFSTQENDSLSELDKAFVRAAKMYPPPEAPIVELPVASATAAEIGQPGETDLFSFEVDRAGEHLVQTTGATDVYMTLFGPGSKTAKVAEDDDSGSGRNALIRAMLNPGVYYIQVRHYSEVRTGQYSIHVSRS